MKKLITAILILYTSATLAQSSINSDLIVNAQRSVDGKQYKIVANKHVPYASSADYLGTIPATRRHVGQIGYVANGNHVDVWQFVNGIADSNFHLVSITLPPNNIAQDSVLSTDTNGIAKNRLFNPWNRSGNLGASYLTDFIGRTDNHSLRFRTNNKERMVLDSLGLLTITRDTADNTRSTTLLIKTNNVTPANLFRVTNSGVHSELDLYSPNFAGVPDAISSDYISTWQTGWTYGQHRLRSYYGLIVEGTGSHDPTPVFLVKKPNVIIATPLFTVGQDASFFGDSTNKPNSYLTITPPTPKGILIPRLSRTNRNSLDSSTNGLLIYNTTVNYFEYSAGGHWKTLTDSSYRSTPGGGGGGGALTDGDYGDITVSLGGTTMNIDDSVINANNIHDVAASTITGTRTHTFISDFATSKAGSADTLVTPRNIYGYPFTGSADLTGVITPTYLPTTIPYYNQVNNFSAGQTQTFQSSATNAGFRLLGPGGDPSSLTAGNMWYNTTDNTFRVRANATTRILANLDEAQTYTNKNLSSSTNTFPGINYFLPTQTSNAGKVLQTDGTNTSWKVKVDSSRAVNDSTLREFYSDGTHYDIPFDAPVQVDSVEHTITPTIAFTTTGGTNPSGTTNNTYQWSRIGKMVTVRVNLSWGTAGTGTVSDLSFNLPADLPTPKRPTGFTSTSDYLYLGDGYLSTTKNSVNADRGRAFIRWDGTNYNIIIKIQTGAAIQYGYATIQYFVP